jgi:hypothetical protein
MIAGRFAVVSHLSDRIPPTMSRASKHLRTINTIVIAGAIGLLVMSLWPGFADGWIACLAIPAIGILAIGWLVIAIVRLTSAQQRKSISLAKISYAPIVVCLTFATLFFYIPLRISFIFFRHRFSRSLPTAVTVNDGYHDDGIEINKWFGIYHVDRCAVEPDGGVYFRTGMSKLLDVDSYGFAYRPNPTHGPFGKRDYEIHHLTGDWYWFEVMWHF